MIFDRSPTESELALLATGGPLKLPLGGRSTSGEVLGGRDTTRSARVWTDSFGPVFAANLGITFEPGSLNLRVKPLEWESPWSFRINSSTWEFCPIILAERAVGLAFRGDRQRSDLLEIASPVHLRTVLGNLQDGDQIEVRLLPGRPLWGEG